MASRKRPRKVPATVPEPPLVGVPLQNAAEVALVPVRAEKVVRALAPWFLAPGLGPVGVVVTMTTAPNGEAKLLRLSDVLAEVDGGPPAPLVDLPKGVKVRGWA